MDEERVAAGAGVQLPRLFPGQFPAQADRRQARYLRRTSRGGSAMRRTRRRQIGELITDLRRHLLLVVAAGHQQHQRQRGGRIGHGAGDQQRRRIAPVHVLQHDQQRLPTARPRQATRRPPPPPVHGPGAAAPALRGGHGRASPSAVQRPAPRPTTAAFPRPSTSRGRYAARRRQRTRPSSRRASTCPCPPRPAAATARPRPSRAAARAAASSARSRSRPTIPWSTPAGGCTHTPNHTSTRPRATLSPARPSRETVRKTAARGARLRRG